MPVRLWGAGGKKTPLEELTPGSATENDILKGLTAWVNGEQLTGKLEIDYEMGISIPTTSSLAYTIYFAKEHEEAPSLFFAIDMDADESNAYKNNWVFTYSIDVFKMFGKVAPVSSNTSLIAMFNDMYYYSGNWGYSTDKSNYNKISDDSVMSQSTPDKYNNYWLTKSFARINRSYTTSNVRGSFKSVAGHRYKWIAIWIKNT